MPTYNESWTLLVATQEKDTTFGNEVTEWNTEVSLLGRSQRITARESTFFGLQGIDVQVKVFVRNCQTIKKADRIKDNATGIVYQITGLTSDKWETTIYGSSI